MAQTIITAFLHTQIAFYRPRKRSYFFLEFDANRLGGPSWVKSNTERRAFTLHKSSTHQQNEAHINYCIGNRRERHRIHIHANGFYLKQGDMIVPLVETFHKFPASMKGIEHTATAPADEDAYLTTLELWRFRTEVPAPPPLPLAPRQQIVVKRKTPIPKRIAWLIAEDAQKQGETCAITMEDITPITAAVTTCFHVFDANALSQWVEQHRTQMIIPCPVCRKNFAMTRAYEQEIEIH